MTVIVGLFGAAIVGLGVFGFVRPKGLVGWARSTWESRSGLHLAIVIRVVLGLLLLATASESRFPQTFRVLGWISLIAAVISPLIGIARLRRFVKWWADKPSAFIRTWSLTALGFGAFLVYAIW